MSKLTKAQVGGFLLDCGYDFVGSLLYGVGILSFTAPNHIAPGGVSGIATIVNYACGAPIGMVNFLINIPLLILGFLFLGKGFTVKTMKSVVIMSFVLDYVCVYIPVYTGNVLVAGLFGGVLMGIGLGVVFMRGSTTGGTDILGRLIQRKAPFIPIGRMLFILDAIILTAAAVVYQNIETALFGLIAMFASAQVMDSVLYGMENGKLVYIISPHNDRISQVLMERLERSATILDGKGAYTRDEKDVIMTVVRKTEFFKLKKIVKEVDPNAFVIVTEAGEILGEGWKDINAD